jgi:inorganic pyrophosphatase
MSLNNVDAGRQVPDEVNVIIEIPAHGDPVKYEVDKKSGALFVDRFMTTAMRYPCNYGYVPHTLGLDGDPVDVLVVAPFPLLSGAVIRCRPVGMLNMTDEAGEDGKILAVPIDKLSVLYRHIFQPEDLPETFLHSISHFFEHYKDLEPGKWVKITGWQNAQAAKKEVMDSVARYNDAKAAVK